MSVPTRGAQLWSVIFFAKSVELAEKQNIIDSILNRIVQSMRAATKKTQTGQLYLIAVQHKSVSSSFCFILQSFLESSESSNH